MNNTFIIYDKEDSYEIFEEKWSEQKITKEVEEDIGCSTFDAHDMVDELVSLLVKKILWCILWFFKYYQW